MPAAIELITRAMRRAGVLAAGETPDAHDTKDALSTLNGVLEQWSLDGLNVYVRDELTFTPAAASFTVGPSGDVAATRPVRIDAAFSRQGGVDTPVDVVGDDRFAQIGMKNMQGRPLLLRYRPTLPDGSVDLWPVPGGEHEIHLIVGRQLNRVEHHADELDLAPGYDRALFLTLALDLCTEYQRPIPAGLVELAMDAVASVKRANLPHDTAQFDAALLLRC